MSAAEGPSIKLTFSLRAIELSIPVDNTGLNGQGGRIPKANRNYLLGSTLCSLDRREEAKGFYYYGNAEVKFELTRLVLLEMKWKICVT